MNRYLRSLPLLLLPCFAHAQSQNALALDPAASVLKWTGHAEVGTYAPSGTLHLHEGGILFRDGVFAGATVVVDMNSMTQENNDLLHHLKSSDFFDVEHYPACLIKIDRVADGIAFGTITIKAKTTPFQSPVSVSTADHHFTITGKLALDRTQYGIVYNSTSFFSGLGNKAIRNTFEVEFSLTGAGQIPQKYRS